MTSTELNEMLKAWSRSFGVRRPPEWDEDSSGDLAGSTHVLLRAVRVGTLTGKPIKKWRSYVTKDGTTAQERAPENVCYGKESVAAARPMYIDPIAEAVDLSLLELYRLNAPRSVVVRVEYGTQGRRRDKVRAVGRILEENMTARRYRHELELGREWLLGRFSNQKRAA